GNAGVVNVYRQSGIMWAGLILLLDMGRAIGVCLLAITFLPTNHIAWVGFGLILGNSYPCVHGFQGGKGVANYLGFCVMVTPITVLIACISWCIAYSLVKIPFLASFVMILILAWGSLNANQYHFVPSLGILLTVLLIVYKHKTNIQGYI
ncbi:MAG: glycerol-3-phosphate acyltransferase, partial [Desulfobacterales bacterium]|nr:glycerol-3-phosphate acyltransferase [Desulfobacterales bacterium]